MSYNSAIIVASGKGSRTSLEIPKQFYRLGGKTVLYRSAEPFSISAHIDEIIVVVHPEYMDYCRKELNGLNKIKRIVAGGESRQQSVFNGLDEVSSNCGLVAVHDGARPFVTCDIIESVIASANGCASVVATSVTDTVKIVDIESGIVKSTPERSSLRVVQTPQVLPYDVFVAARLKAEEDGFSATDDVSLAELVGCPVKTVNGRPDNIKITYDIDISLAEAIFALRSEKL